MNPDRGSSPAPLAPGDPLALVALVLALPLAHGLLLGAGGFDLHFDEAQYWTWSRHLDWSYATKGPLVAWLIALGEAVFGSGEGAVRALAWGAHGLFLVLLFLFALEVWGSRRAAWTALALGLVTPLYFLLGGVMTTDVFLFACWTGALWALWRALAQGRPGAWYAMGAWVGVGALAKLSIGLLPLFAGVALLARREWRGLLVTREPWLAAGLVLVIMSPMVLWNAGNGWVALRHEQGHVLGHGNPSGNLAEFAAGQVVALSPLVAVLLLVAVVPWPRDRGQGLIAWVSLGVLGFFLVKAGLSKVQPNWAAPAYVGLMVVAAGRIATWGRGGRRLLAAALVLAVAMVVLLHFPGLARVPSDRDPFVKLKAWEGPVAALAAALPEARFVLASDYGLVAELAYYWPGRPPVYQVGATDRRLTQFDLWPGPERERGRAGAYVSLHGDLPKRVEAAFARCAPVTPMAARGADGRVLRTLHAWACTDFQAPPWPRPQRH